MQIALHPPADIAAWIATLPAADQVELTNFYADWYRSLPLKLRLSFFRCLMECDKAPRGTAIYEPGFLPAVADFFNAIQNPWAIHFALDQVSTPGDLALTRKDIMLSPCGTLELAEYKTIASDSELTAAELLAKLMAITDIRATDKSRAVVATRKRVEAFMDAASALVPSPPLKKEPIEKHPDVSLWLAGLPKSEQEEVNAFLKTARSRPNAAYGQHLYLLVGLAQLDPGPGKRPAFDAPSVLSLSMPGVTRKHTYLAELLSTVGVANNKVYLAFALTCLPTLEDIQNYLRTSWDVKWEYLNMADYQAVAKRVLKKGVDLHAFHKALVNRSNKNRLASPTGLGELPSPERNHQLNKEELIKLEREYLSLLYC